LREQNFERQIFGRLNQKSSIEAASESDRGIVERLANAFDSSLTAARLAFGIERSDKTLTPRNAAQRFFCARPENRLQRHGTGDFIPRPTVARNFSAAFY
jgi:hypothetical protein